MTSFDLPGNTKKAVSFLRSFRPKGYINVVAIKEYVNDKSIVMGITRPISSIDIDQFIKENNGSSNLYFMVNEPDSNAPDNKLAKKYVDKIHAVWLDADPDRSKPFIDERQRILAFADELMMGDNAPTYIVDSGGGIQAFWVLKQPVIATEDNVKLYEGMSRSLAETHGTDHVHNIDRIMRIPYTMNIPSQKKRDAGRVETLSRVYSINSDKPEGVRYD